MHSTPVRRTPPRSCHPSPGAPLDPAIVTLADAAVQTSDGRTLLRVDELVVAPGERVIVTGPSGAGKTLLLRALSGRLPTGLTMTGARTARLARVATVPQRGADALHPLVAVGAQLRRATRASRDRVGEVLRAVGLDERGIARRRPAELSGGQAQRAAIALAVLSDAPLVLADEPTSALDHETRDRILDLLTRVLAPAQALVLSTHDPAVAARLGARHLRLADGRIAP